MSTPKITISAAILMILIFIIQLNFSITDNLALKTTELSKEPWTVLTSGFAHSSVQHLTNNLLFFVLFGVILERTAGSKIFLIFLALSIIVANLSAFFFYPNSNVLGASGAVSAFLVALAVYRPKMVTIYFGVFMRMWLVLIIWLITNLLISAVDTNIAAEAHLFGGVFGLLTGFWLRKKYPTKEDERKSQKEINLKEKEIDKWEKEHMR